MAWSTFGPCGVALSISSLPSSHSRTVSSETVVRVYVSSKRGWKKPVQRVLK
nr:hypothetical protein [Streptomyces sp. 9-7]